MLGVAYSHYSWEPPNYLVPMSPGKKSRPNLSAPTYPRHPPIIVRATRRSSGWPLRLFYSPRD